jgi:hypothetical protein
MAECSKRRRPDEAKRSGFAEPSAYSCCKRPNDREAGWPGRPDRSRGDADEDAEAEAERDRKPGRIEGEGEATARPADQQYPDHEPNGRPDGRSDDAQNARLDDDHAPNLTAGHAGRTQHADLPNALQNAHGEGVDHAQAGDQDAIRARASSSRKIRSSASPTVPETGPAVWLQGIGKRRHRPRLAPLTPCRADSGRRRNPRPVTPNLAASGQPIRIASWDSAGIERATMPTTAEFGDVEPVANSMVSPTWMPAGPATDSRHDRGAAGRPAR